MEKKEKSAAAVEKEGAKVTGGNDAANGDTDATTSQEGSEEYIPEDEDKKEDMNGYNELPEQSKVGGG